MIAAKCTAPSIGENHPSALACDAIHNAAQIAVGVGEYATTDDDRKACGARIVELLALASGHVAALYTLFRRQERTIEEQRVECLREKEYSTKVEDKNSELSQRIITLARELGDLRVRVAELASPSSLGDQE